MSRALILAAGQGTRLRPLTDDRPKCLVPLLGKSLLERQAHTLREAGITEIQVATGYRCELIRQLGFDTSFNSRFADTNMVETLFSARTFIEREGDLVIAYGDIVYQLDNLQAVLACDDEIALMIDAQWRDLWSLRRADPLTDAETLVIDGEGYVTELGNRPDGYERIQGQYTGLIKVRSDKIEDFVGFYENLDRRITYGGKNFENMYMTSFLQCLIDSGWKAKAVLVNGGWLEIDSVEDLQQYETMAKDGRLSRFYRIDDVK